MFDVYHVGLFLRNHNPKYKNNNINFVNKCKNYKIKSEVYIILFLFFS